MFPFDKLSKVTTDPNPTRKQENDVDGTLCERLEQFEPDLEPLRVNERECQCFSRHLLDNASNSIVAVSCLKRNAGRIVRWDASCQRSDVSAIRISRYR